MRASGLSPYDGDMLHLQPVLLDLFGPVIDTPHFLFCIFVVLDILTAELLRLAAIAYIEETRSVDEHQKEDIVNFVAKCYLFNPIAIASCAVLSLSVFYNLLTALFILSYVKGWLARSAVLYSALVHFTLYSAVFICALPLKFKSGRQRALLFFISLSSLAFFGLINLLSNGNLKHIDSTYMFLLDVRDLSPNVGIFWYFFIEVFNHFRPFFLWVFQINILVYLLPLAVTVRSNPFLLLHQLIILVSVFSSYPSMADSVIYLSLMPVFAALHKYIRWGLIVGATMATCVVLSPIMWRMWIDAGSGNANFYFAVTLSYSIAQIFLLTDLLYAHLRKKVADERGEAIEKDVALFTLK